MYVAFWDSKAEGPVVKAPWGRFRQLRLGHSLPKEGWGWALVKGAVASLLRLRSATLSSQGWAQCRQRPPGIRAPGVHPAFLPPSCKPSSL